MQPIEKLTVSVHLYVYVVSPVQLTSADELCPTTLRSESHTVLEIYVLLLLLSAPSIISTKSIKHETFSIRLSAHNDIETTTIILPNFQTQKRHQM